MVEAAGVALLGGAFTATALVLLFPGRALSFGVVLLLVGGTKFRTRDPAALLRGDIDSQVLFELAITGLVALIAALALLRPLRPRRMSGPELAMVGYLLFVLGSAFWAPAFDMTVVRALQLCVIAALAQAMVNTWGAPRTLSIVAASIVTYVIVVSVIGWAAGSSAGTAYVPLTVTVKNVISRFSVFAVHPLVIAALSTVAVLLVFADLLFASQERRLTLFGTRLWPFLPVLLLILLKAHSRGATVALVAGMVFLFSRRYLFGVDAKRGVLALTGTGIAAVVIVLATLSMVAMQGGGPVGSFILRGESVAQLSSLNGRLEVFRVVAALFQDRPFLGYGFLASRSLLLDHIWWAGHAHNGIAESLLNVGLIGTALLWGSFFGMFIGVVSLTLRSWGDSARTPAMIAACALFLLLNSLVSPGIAGPPEFEFLLYCVMVCAYSDARQAGLAPGAQPGVPLLRRGPGSSAVGVPAFPAGGPHWTTGHAN